MLAPAAWGRGTLVIFMIRRLLQAIVVLLLVTMITYALLRMKIGRAHV